MKKSKKFTHTCSVCDKEYKSADVKGKFCYDCKQPRPCKCGCGTLVKTPGYFYARGCKTRGKTYKQIYGTENPTNGFAAGENNPNYDPEIKERATQSLLEFNQNNPDKVRDRLKKAAKTRSNLTDYNSVWEREVHHYLSQETDMHIDREYDVKLDRGVKIVDFVLYNDDIKIYIEVTGLSFIVAKDKFIDKIKRLSKAVYPDCVLILTKKESLTYEISEFVNQYELLNTFVENFNNKNKVKELLKFTSTITKLQEI